MSLHPAMPIMWWKAVDPYIDMSGKECISHPHVLYYRDMPLDEVLKKGIQFSIDKDCRVVVMKTMECHDRH